MSARTEMSLLRASLVSAGVLGAAYLWFRRRQQIAAADASVPVVNLWTEVVLRMITVGRSDLPRLLAQVISEKYPGESAVIVRTYPFSDVYVLKNLDGVKFFHAAKELDLALEYHALLGGVRADEVNETSVSEDINMVAMISKSFRSENLARFAVRVVIPEIESFIARFSARSDTFVPDTLETIYLLTSRIAVRVFGEHTFGKNDERINQLGELMQDADIETIIKKSPLNAVLPGLAHLKKQREALYDKLRVLTKEIVNDYVATHKEVLNLTGEAKEEFEDRDLCEAAIRGLWDPKTQTVDPNLVFGVVYNLLFAAVSNQYVITTLYLAHVDKNPEFKAAILEELRPLTQWLSARAHARRENGGSLPAEFDEAMPLEILDKMPLLEAGFLETVRLSSVGFAPRITSKDTTFKASTGSEIRIPAGSMVTSYQGMVHLNPELNADPMEFRPHRFIDPVSGDCIGPVAASNRGFFIGFGAGRHPCTGTRFANMQIKLVIALISLHWDANFDTLPPIDTQIVGVSRPIAPLRMNFSVRPQP